MAGQRPRPQMTWWIRLRRFIRFFESPLKLRSSLKRLRHNNPHPFLALLRLFIPLPTWHFSIPDPVPIRIILNNIPLLNERRASQDLANMRSIPIWRARDTPLRCLYRIYEAMAARETYAISPEVEYFWYQSRRAWVLDRVPDPCDPDPVRYAILASIAEELAEGFNWRLSLGMRRVKSQHIYPKSFDEELPPFTPMVAPSWTKRVPPVDVDMIADLPSDFLDSSGRLVLEEGGDTPAFVARNIMTGTGDFYTV